MNIVNKIKNWKMKQGEMIALAYICASITVIIIFTILENIGILS